MGEGSFVRVVRDPFEGVTGVIERIVLRYGYVPVATLRVVDRGDCPHEVGEYLLARVCKLVEAV